MESPEAVGKGWIRDAILASLSKDPATLTRLASEVNVAKSTVGYHLGRLLRKGLIQISETRLARGGVVSKTYSLGKGAMVLLPTAEEENNELRHLEEVFQTWTLTWPTREDPTDGRELRLLLYRLFLHLFLVTRSQHRSILRAYGRKVGALAAGRVAGHRGREAMLELVRWAGRTNVAAAEVIDIPASRFAVLVLHDCLDSTEHPGRACWFLEGIVEGIVTARLGSSWVVSRIENPGIPDCCLAVGRGRQMDGRFMREAILSSPLRRNQRPPIPRGR